MVASEPGDWFEDTLDSLAATAYENLSVLVIDNAGNDSISEELAVRIAAVLPSAFVKRAESGNGFSAAANEALRSVEGAAFYLFLHDDVLLYPDAVTELVAEAFRSNSGIVGAKLVDWDDHQRLLSVGIRVDPYGFAAQISEPGELDQSQHDTPRPVFAVADACMLVRADLFATLGGFDEDIPFFGEEIDLCWRAHVAGASVEYCPSAVVAHRERFEQRRPLENRQTLEIRHHARVMLKNYSIGRLLLVVPMAFLLSVVDLVASAVLGHFRRSGDIATAWVWNLVHTPSLVGARRRTRKARTVPDGNYVVLMRQGSSRLRSLVRGTEGENRLQALASSGRGYLREATSRSRRAGVAMVLIALVFGLYGARGLIFGDIPTMRELPLLGRSAGQMLSEWLGGWRETGLGEPAVSPGVIPASGILGWLLFGSLSAARRVLFLGTLILGALGSWKLLNRSGSTATRAGFLVVYSLNPVVLNAVAAGRFQALVMYAAAPWLLRRVATAARIEPFIEGTLDGTEADDPSRSAVVVPVNEPRLARTVAGCALILSAVAALSPLGALLLAALVLILGLVIVGSGARAQGLRILTMGISGLLISAVVNAPWLYSALRSGDGSTLTGYFRTAVRSPSAAQILTGSVGPVRTGALGWGLLLAALFALVAARSWRLKLTVFAWVTALGSWFAAVMMARSGLFGGAGLELVLMPSVLAVSMAVAMGILAFEKDVLGSDFGAEQILAGVAALGLVIGLVPIGIASIDGRWFQPQGDFESVLDPVDSSTNFRTVWVGDPDVLPLAGWPLGHENLAIGTSVGLNPTLTSRYRTEGGAGVDVLTAAIQAAIDGQSSRLGRILAPMGVKYVVVVDRPAPLPYTRARVSMPSDLVSALRSQVDLSPIDVNPAMAMFRVDGTWPLRSDISAAEGVDKELKSLREQLWIDPGLPPAVLGKNSGTRFTGELKSGTTIFQAVTADPGWDLKVNGSGIKRADWRGWGQKLEVSASGKAVLKFSPPKTFRALQLLQLGTAIALIAVVLGVGRPRRKLTKSGPSTPTDQRILSVGLLADVPSGDSMAESVESTDLGSSTDREHVDE
ncbi:MAG: glycosyltransferase [Microthrixaceae bacterium]|nr:glycosyltransferase [Microthrixaceae bacterium]